MKLKFLFFAMVIYLLGGLLSTIDVGYLIIHYYLLSRAKWYLVDFSINLIDLVGLFITLIILIKGVSDKKKIFLYRCFITSGLFGVFVLIALRFFFRMAMPNFPPKLSIASLILDGVLIKIILDQKINPSKVWKKENGINLHK